jgi:hypothetical protein
VDVRIAIPDEHIRPAILNAGLEAVTRLNEGLISRGQVPTFDEAVDAGVRWKAEPPGAERFDHAKTVHDRKWGDCDDLAPYHAATLRATGEDPDARAVVFKSGPHMWHAITERGDGSFEDPSQTAGMRVRRGSRTEGIRPAAVSLMAGPSVSGESRPYVAIDKDSGAWVGRADIPIGRGKYAIAVTHRASSPSQALGLSMHGAAMVGGCSGMCQGEHVDKLFALSGLLRGKSPRNVAAVVGAETVEEALKTIAELCPAILDELRAHRHAVEGSPRRGGGFRAS